MFLCLYGWVLEGVGYGVSSFSLWVPNLPGMPLILLLRWSRLLLCWVWPQAAKKGLLFSRIIFFCALACVKSTPCSQHKPTKHHLGAENPPINMLTWSLDPLTSGMVYAVLTEPKMVVKGLCDKNSQDSCRIPPPQFAERFCFQRIYWER